VTLIDTGPLVALCDARDGTHRTAVGHLASLAAGGLAVCEAVLVEACFHLPHQSQRARLRGLLRDLCVESMAPDDHADLWPEVFDWLAKYAEHEPDWADACLAVLSGRDRSVKVWSYDREFRTTWRRPDGTAIPMAVRERPAPRPR
jgi:predicted nucleic acid-binding protein